jgi:hypothetical protein
MQADDGNDGAAAAEEPRQPADKSASSCHQMRLGAAVM